MTEQEAKKYLLIFSPGILVISALAMICAYILDPFQIFHESYFVKDHYIKNYERYQNAGLIQQIGSRGDCCDTLIIGTSHSQNFLPNQVSKNFGDGGTLQLSLWASLPSEQLELLEKALKKKPTQRVIWDIHTAFAGPEIHRPNDAKRLQKDSALFFPEYLYDDQRWNDIFYLASIDIGPHFLKQIMWGKPYETYQSWYEETKEQFGRGKLLGKTNTNFVSKEWHHGSYKFPNIDKILIPAIQKHPDQIFYLFIAPYSRHYYAIMPEEQYNRLMAMRLYLADTVEKLPNAKLFVFDETFRSVENLDDYKDFDHFSEETSNRILEYMARDKSRLRASLAEQDIKNVTRAVNRYIEHYPENEKTSE